MHPAVTRASFLLLTLCFGAASVSALLAVASPSSPSFFLPDCNDGGVRVAGVWAEVDDELGGTVRVGVFRSIPYAVPPVGPFRFRPTELATCPPRSRIVNGTFDASTFGPICPQQGWNSPAVLGAEDCLTLTLHVPEWALNATQTSLPVLVYLYGGDLTSGDESEPMSFFAANTPPRSGNGAASTGVIVVVPNYRLGAAGWLAVAAMENERQGSDAVGNWGLMDQITALKWVHSRIGVVGGDASQVSIAGQSSGGTSVLALTQTPAAGSLFRAGISLSGSPNITMDRVTKYRQDDAYASALGCGERQFNSSAQQMACLRSVPVDKLVSSMPGSWDAPGVWNLLSLNKRTNGGLNLAGVIFVDGRLLLSSVVSSMSAGVNGNITLLFGSMGQEGNLDSADQHVNDFTAAQWSAFLRDQVFASWPNASVIARRVEQLYAKASQVNPQLAYFSINADYGIGCANAVLAASAANSAARTAPVYLFLNEHPLSEPNDNRALSYAFHVEDFMTAIQDWTRYNSTFAPKASDLRLSQQLRTHWGTLIATGTLESLGSEWSPVSRGATATSGLASFVYGMSSRFPFIPRSGTVIDFLAEKCDLFTSLGIGQDYWWCD